MQRAVANLFPKPVLFCKVSSVICHKTASEGLGPLTLVAEVHCKGAIIRRSLQ